MKFNINKYDNVRFHSDELTNKRIKALLLWFEYEVYKRNPTKETKLLLIDKWIDILVKQEYYEVVPFFRNMKIDINKESDRLVTDNMTQLVEKVSFLTNIKHKIRNIYTLIFKK